MNYDFKLFEPIKKYKINVKKGGMRIGKSLATVIEQKVLECEKINVYLDLKNNAIKITEGDNYTYRNAYRKDITYKQFNSSSIVKSGIKTGDYKYEGDGIFVFDTEQD